MRVLGVFCFAACLTIGSLAGANVYTDHLMALAERELKDWRNDPILIEALRTQNAEYATLTRKDVRALDREWRREIGAAHTPLIDRVLSAEASAQLRRVQAESGGLISEIIVMDSHGLNVGQTDITSDFWQGDEAKFTETYGFGSEDIYIGDIEYDESTMRYQSQVSMSITDPDTQLPIGVITFGIDVSEID